MPHIPRNIQSPYTATDFWNKWSSVNPRMALFIKVTPITNPVISTIGFTSNSRDMILPAHSGVVFRSAVGITPSAIEQKLDEALTLELSGIYQTGIFERDDILGGRWDFADVEVFSASWDNTALGELVHFKGNLGEFRDLEESFTAEGRGLIARLSNDVSQITTRNCRVKEFGDSQCGFSGSTVTIDGETYDIFYPNATAYTASDRKNMYIANGYWDSGIIPKPVPPQNYFANGLMIGVTGANEGIIREVLYNDDGSAGKIRFSVKRAFPFPIEVGDGFDLKAGCNRTLEDCKKYGNVINFRGEPFIPGFEAMNRVPPSQ